MEFKKVYDKYMDLLGSKMKDFPWEDKQAYAEWLGQTYHFAKDTTRLLALAGFYTTFEKPKLHDRFIDHAKEERGHERILLKDLKEIGFDIENIPECAATAALYKSQYYWIQHKNLMAFFGYIIMLEAIGALYCKKAYDRAATQHGKKAAVFLKVHSDEDIGHVDIAMKQIMDLSPLENKMVIENFVHSSEFYIGLLDHAAKGAKTSASVAA